MLLTWMAWPNLDAAVCHCLCDSPTMYLLQDSRLWLLQSDNKWPINTKNREQSRLFGWKLIGERKSGKVYSGEWNIDKFGTKLEKYTPKTVAIKQMKIYIISMKPIEKSQHIVNNCNNCSVFIALWGSWKKWLKVVNFRSLFLRSFLQKIRKSLLNAVLTPQESTKNLVLKKLKQKKVKKAKKPVAHVC